MDIFYSKRWIQDTKMAPIYLIKTCFYNSKILHGVRINLTCSLKFPVKRFTDFSFMIAVYLSMCFCTARAFFSCSTAIDNWAKIATRLTGAVSISLNTSMSLFHYLSLMLANESSVIKATSSIFEKPYRKTNKENEEKTFQHAFIL